MPYTSRDSDILAALQSGSVLTPAVAHSRWGVLALHSAIARLRKLGHVIPCKLVNGHGEYTLSVPQRSIANETPAPSREGVGRGDVAGGTEPHERLITTTGRSADGKRTYPLQFVSVGPGPGWPPDQDAARRSRRG